MSPKSSRAAMIIGTRARSMTRVRSDGSSRDSTLSDDDPSDSWQQDSGKPPLEIAPGLMMTPLSAGSKTPESFPDHPSAILPPQHICDRVQRPDHVDRSGSKGDGINIL